MHVLAAFLLLAAADAATDPTAPDADPELEAIEKLDVAVMRIALAEGLPGEIGPAMDELVLQRLAEYSYLKVIGYTDIVAMLQQEARKQLIGCQDDDSCFAEIAGALGAALLVVGTLTELDSEYVLSLKLLDSARGEVLGRSSVTTGESAIADEVPAAVDSMLKDASTSEGERSLVVAQALGWEPLSGTRRASPWIAGGVAAALAITGVVYGVDANSKASDARNAVQGTPAWVDADQAASDSARVADALFIGAGVATVGAALLWWWNASEEGGLLLNVGVTPEGAAAVIMGRF